MANEGTSRTGMAFIAQMILGGVMFFVFFATLFNGLDQWIVVTAVTGLGLNFVTSLLLAKRSIRDGALAAVVYAGPALLFAAFSLGDAVFLGRPEPFVFWFLGALAATGAGMLGALARVFRDAR